MPVDRLTEIRIEGLKVIDHAAVPLRGLTVLIGENGVGKSTVLDALELLRLAGHPANYVSDVLGSKFGGLQNLIRRRSAELKLTAHVEGDGPAIDYTITAGFRGDGRAQLFSEELRECDLRGTWRTVLSRDGDGGARIVDEPAAPPRQVNATMQQLVLPSIDLLGPPPARRMIKALRSIDYQVPFDTRPFWQHRENERHTNGPRWPTAFRRVERLERFGNDLSNAFQQLKNAGGDVWDRVLHRARVGLGPELRDISFDSPSHGQLQMVLAYARWPGEPLPVSSLSEGQLSYLCLIAACELGERRSVFALDEPELHLHPALLANMVWMLEAVAEQCPVVVATQSSRLLDALETPASSVVLCDAGPEGAMRMTRPNPEHLTRWLERYSGLGAVRDAGYEPHVFDEGPRVDGEPK